MRMGPLGTLQSEQALSRQVGLDAEMDCASVCERLSVLKEDLRSLGVTGLALVGSVARGEATRNSDIDIVIDTVDEFALSDLCEVGHFLEGRTGRNVDVVHCDVLFTANPLDALPEEIRRNVIHDMVSVF